MFLLFQQVSEETTPPRQTLFPTRLIVGVIVTLYVLSISAFKILAIINGWENYVQGFLATYASANTQIVVDNPEMCRVDGSDLTTQLLKSVCKNMYLLGSSIDIVLVILRCMYYGILVGLGTSVVWIAVTVWAYGVTSRSLRQLVHPADRWRMQEDQDRPEEVCCSITTLNTLYSVVTWSPKPLTHKYLKEYHFTDAMMFPPVFIGVNIAGAILVGSLTSICLIPFLWTENLEALIPLQQILIQTVESYFVVWFGRILLSFFASTFFSDQDGLKRAKGFTYFDTFYGLTTGWLSATQGLIRCLQAIMMNILCTARVHTTNFPYLFRHHDSGHSAFVGLLLSHHYILFYNRPSLQRTATNDGIFDAKESLAISNHPNESKAEWHLMEDDNKHGPYRLDIPQGNTKHSEKNQEEGLVLAVNPPENHYRPNAIYSQGATGCLTLPPVQPASQSSKNELVDPQLAYDEDIS